MTSRTSNQLRDEGGVIVTVVARSTERPPVSVTRSGLVTKALLDCLALFDPEEYRVVAISTPRTILLDLKGRKTFSVEENTKRNRLDGSTRIERRHRVGPEAALLGRVGKMEYL